MQESFSELRILRGEDAGGDAKKFADIAFKNLIFLREFYYYPIVDSTNERAREKKSINALFFAEKQKAGKGRMKRKWLSSEGGLWFSITLKGNPSKLSLLAAVSVAEAIPFAKIKWPNDILLNDLKICGILGEVCEDFVILGIGINVENDVSSIENAGRICDFYAMSRFEVFDLVTAKLGENLSKNWKEVFEKYRSLCETIGCMVRVETFEGEIFGVADVDEDGTLILNGKKIYAGDCIHLRKFLG